jgi:hypothetical protein
VNSKSIDIWYQECFKGYKKHLIGFSYFRDEKLKSPIQAEASVTQQVTVLEGLRISWFSTYFALLNVPL